MPHPDRLLLHMSDTNITSITNKLLSHSQCLRVEGHAHAAAAASVAAYAPIAINPAPIPTFSDAPLSDTPDNSSIFLSALPSENPVKEYTPVPDSVPSDLNPSGEPSSLPYTIPNYILTEEPTFPSEIPTEVPALDLDSEPNDYYPSVELSIFPYLFPPYISP